MTQAHRVIEVGLGNPPVHRMNEGEFIKWCREGDGNRAEWVDGETVLMAPDNTEHNSIAGFVFTLMDGWSARHGSGRVFFENVQLRFPKIRRRRQPDLVFVSKERLHIIEKNHIEGPPDLVMEIVSPDSSARDYRDKFIEYERAGVKEYWVIDPLTQRVEAHVLGRARRYSRIPEKDGKISSLVLTGFYVKSEWFWKKPLPNWLGILKEMGVIK